MIKNNGKVIIYRYKDLSTILYIMNDNLKKNIIISNYWKRKCINKVCYNNTSNYIDSNYCIFDLPISISNEIDSNVIYLKIIQDVFIKLQNLKKNKNNILNIGWCSNYENTEKNNLNKKKSISYIYNKNCNEIKKLLIENGIMLNYGKFYKTNDKDYIDKIFTIIYKLVLKKIIVNDYNYGYIDNQLIMNYSNPTRYIKFKYSLIIKFLLCKHLSIYSPIYLLSDIGNSIISNFALGIDSQLIYILFFDKKTKEKYIVEKSCLYNLYNSFDHIIIIQKIIGKELINIKYNHPLKQYIYGNYSPLFRTIDINGIDNYNLENNKTGIYNISPLFHTCDTKICKKNNINFIIY